MSPAATVVWSAVVASITGLASGYLGAGLRASSPARTGDFEVLSTHRLSIVNPSGVECGRFEGGSHAGPRDCSLVLGGMIQDDPCLILSVDNLEGTPTAKVQVRSRGVGPGAAGSLFVQSMHGRPSVVLSETAVDSGRQYVNLGFWERGEPSVLHLERAGQIFEWPK